MVLISDYITNYTAGKRINFNNVLDEAVEFIKELLKLNRAGIKEEWQDVFHFLQLYLYWRFGLNQSIWNCTQESVNKFIERRNIWRKIYKLVGLDPNISNYCGNYKREAKVVSHLAQFGVSQSDARKAFHEVLTK